MSDNPTFKLVPPEDPKNAEEWLWYIRFYERGIFVRDGAEAVSLDKLPPDRWAYWVSRWASEGVLPVRVRGDDELVPPPAPVPPP